MQVTIAHQRGPQSGATIHHAGLREPQAHWAGTVQESTVFVLFGENNGHLTATMIRRGDRHV